MAMAARGRQHMRLQRIRSENRRYSWRDRARDPALTAMLAVQCLIIFSEPLDAMGFETVSEAVQLLFFAITFIVYLIVRGPIATTLAISALIAICVFGARPGTSGALSSSGVGHRDVRWKLELART